MDFAVFSFLAFPIALFVLLRLGIFKSWYILKPLSGLYSSRSMFALLPMSSWLLILTFVIPVLPGYDPDKFAFQLLLMITMFGGLLVSFWFMYRPPKWLKPSWLQWLEQEYGYCIPILIQEAQKMNRWRWEEKVRTHVGLQAWIDTAFVNRRDDIEFAWQAEKLERIMAWLTKQKIYKITPGMEIEGDIPEHRQDDIALTREGIDAVVAVKNKYYLDNYTFKQ